MLSLQPTRGKGQPAAVCTVTHFPPGGATHPSALQGRESPKVTALQSRNFRARGRPGSPWPATGRHTGKVSVPGRPN